LGFWGQGSGLRVSGSVFRVSGFRFRVSSFGFRVQDLGFKIWGFGALACSMRCMCSSSESSWSCEAFGGIKGSGFWVWNFGFRLSGSGVRDQVSRGTVTCQVVEKQNRSREARHPSCFPIPEQALQRGFMHPLVDFKQRPRPVSNARPASHNRCSGFDNCRQPKIRK